MFAHSLDPSALLYRKATAPSAALETRREMKLYGALSLPSRSLTEFKGTD